uniref:Uncharacterized protein n=1 Tax=Cacopsylla melanoneura TaxID=428564 RepID=A0A8D9F6Y9_9HEMI
MYSLSDYLYVGNTRISENHQKTSKISLRVNAQEYLDFFQFNLNPFIFLYSHNFLLSLFLSLTPFVFVLCGRTMWQMFEGCQEEGTALVQLTTGHWATKTMRLGSNSLNSVLHLTRTSK